MSPYARAQPSDYIYLHRREYGFTPRGSEKGKKYGDVLNSNARPQVQSRRWIHDTIYSAEMHSSYLTEGFLQLTVV